eukprot:3798850-Amphidinium_carterae.1
MSVDRFVSLVCFQFANAAKEGAMGWGEDARLESPNTRWRKLTAGFLSERLSGSVPKASSCGAVLASFGCGELVAKVQ